MRKRYRVYKVDSTLTFASLHTVHALFDSFLVALDDDLPLDPAEKS